MSRVNKVIIGAHSVMADGGIMAASGTYSVAQAAHHFSIPIIVCAAIYKLTPRYPTCDTDELNVLVSPSDSLPYAGVLDSVKVYTPADDYVPPKLIELLITNYGGYAPSYIYRLLREYYHPDDMFD
ncbi:hypothetical protein Zmor_016278 [Zophobas morio]|uniref:Translation initiation factor eIF2B subunit beta n=1 Tax=Zophobas morio TaxID=2755281 RepID=A0AA38HG12_9CUCU|nr:hypothetical protein Zmor_016278 [Zophobas morio]